MNASLRRRPPCRGLFLAIPCFAAMVPSTALADSAARDWNEQLLDAIRRNVPHPPAHARNLFHTAVAMYNAWAAYDQTAVGYIYNEKAATLPPDVEAARREAISYAAHRVLSSRFSTGSGSADSLTSFNNQLTAMGYSVAAATAATTNDPTPAELGKRVGQAILNWGAIDGFGQIAYPQAYNSTVNINMSPGRELNALGQIINQFGLFVANMPLGYGIPANTDPNLWQPLALSSSVSQNGIPTPGGVQGFIGVQGLASTPFSLTRTDPTKPWIDLFGGPSRLSMPGNPSPTDAAYKENALDVLRKSALLNDLTPVNISPGAIGNNPMGTDDGTGFTTNPITSVAYADNFVTTSDYVRVLAEFWADGPHSETPPGHWHVLANDVADHPQTVKRIGGTGPVVNDLEWDVKMYFAVSAATHDAACVAWSLKRYYSGPRPITMIRYMGSRGQSSNPAGPSYHSQGLPLEPGVVEVVTTESAAAHHAQIWDVTSNASYSGTWYVGSVVVKSWPGEHPDNPAAATGLSATHQSLVRWQLAKDWMPFQRKTFNTPAFPGFTSGHSTFSRSAAEALTLFTGSHLFPGGFHHHTVPANSMQIDKGPSTNVDLQWCSYYDAADQAGQSRRWGGIHPYEDDYVGRRTGEIAGKSAYALAEKYWTGAITDETFQAEIAMLPNGHVRVTWNATRGMYHKVEVSEDLSAWEDATAYSLSYVNGAVTGDSSGTWIDTAPPPGRRYYQVRRSATP